MAKSYLLGQQTARKLAKLLHAGPLSENIRNQTSAYVDDVEWPDPWTVTYAASVVADSTEGHWIVWIPDGSWAGASVETNSSNPNYMAPAGGEYPTGWFVFPSSVEDAILDSGTTHVYASVSSSKKIMLSTATGGVKLADVICDDSTGSKQVRQVCRSTIVSSPEPWQFACQVNPTTQARTGGWTNGRLQIGYDPSWGTPDVQTDASRQIGSTNVTADGWHSLEINLLANTVGMIVTSSKPSSSYENGIIRIPIGRVSNAVLQSCIHVNPVCYTIV